MPILASEIFLSENKNNRENRMQSPFNANLACALEMFKLMFMHHLIFALG